MANYIALANVEIKRKKRGEEKQSLRDKMLPCVWDRDAKRCKKQPTIGLRKVAVSNELKPS